MITLDLQLPDTRYPIHIGRGLLDQVELLLPHIKAKVVAIVTNEVVAPLYLERLSTQLSARGIRVIPIVLPDGESHKNWQTLNLIFDALLAHQRFRIEIQTARELHIHFQQPRSRDRRWIDSCVEALGQPRISVFEAEGDGVALGGEGRGGRDRRCIR